MTDLERDFDISRDPSEYDPTVHLLQRLREGGQRTVLEYDMVAEAIEDGEITEKDEDEVVIEYQWLQTEMKIVIDPEAKNIKTAYEVES